MKQKRPDDIDVKGIEATVCPEIYEGPIWLCVGSFGGSIDLKQAKVLQKWLGKAIEYLETKEGV